MTFPTLTTEQTARLGAEAALWGRMASSCEAIEHSRDGRDLCVTVAYYGTYYADRIESLGVGAEYIVFRLPGVYDDKGECEEWHFFLNGL